jgi:hypothetical protein
MSKKTEDQTVEVRIRWNPETKDVEIQLPVDLPLLHQLEFLLDLRGKTLQALRGMGETLLRQGL